MKINEVGSILAEGEGQVAYQDVSFQMLTHLIRKAKSENKFLYTWSRGKDLRQPGMETFIVLSKEPPAFEPSLKYTILVDPTGDPQEQTER